MPARLLTLVLAAAPLMVATSASAEMTVNIGGRIHLDAAFYDEDVTPLGSGTEFRRVRGFISGAIDENWDYKWQVDFADGDADIKDVFVRYNGLDFGRVTIGNFKVPFSLEEMISSKYITFMERAMINAFAPSRRIGAGIDRATGSMTMAAAVYGDEPSDSATDEGVGIAGRVTFTPVNDGQRMIHLGAAALFEEPSNTDSGADTVRFRARPESHVTGTRLIDTGSIADVSGISKFGLEAAAILGPFSLQGEYIATSVDAAGGDADFDGYYAYASWFPGGGTRAYKDGIFQRTKVDNAWEFALRYSQLSLDDGVIAGGEETNITFAANYYVNPYLRFMANYILADVERAGFADEDPSVFQLRVSMDFK